MTSEINRYVTEILGDHTKLAITDKELDASRKIEYCIRHLLSLNSAVYWQHS